MWCKPGCTTAIWLGGGIARLAGVPRICWGIRNTSLEPGKSSRSTIWIARINARLSRWVPQAIVCCAERAREVHAALGYAAEKMVVIPNGYDLERFKPDRGARDRLRRDWGVADDLFLIGMVGRFDPQKDHANLISALGEFKRAGGRFRCVLVGKDLTQDNAAINAWIAEQGLAHHVLLLGQRNDIPAVMNALDVHVLSSSAEAFPNVLAEAMACGTPCVSTDVGDAALIVGDTGWVVPPRNPQALADGMRAALRAKEQATVWATRQLAVRQRVVDNFSLQKMTSAYQGVWQLLHDRPPRS